MSWGIVATSAASLIGGAMASKGGGGGGSQTTSSEPWEPAQDWIKQNIAQFGGNPDNITVSGFSAGGRDVMAMLISNAFAAIWK